MKNILANILTSLITVIAVPFTNMQGSKTVTHELLVGAAVRDITPKVEWLPL